MSTPAQSPDVPDALHTGEPLPSTLPQRPWSSHPRPRHWIPLIIVLVLAFSIVVPPLFNIERYQHRIAADIGRSIGRPVHFSHISLRLLPRPGFELSNFTVEEGPGFGPEPILRSTSVSASIRLPSLWRGRLEIARISFDEPSLNLVRNAEGRWNFASVMTQASQTPIAPTGQPEPGHALRFPYIEASNARINFKYGLEKQPFSFMNGDLALWLDDPDKWQLRFTAQPVRTDLDMFASNTGLVRIEGSMKRAAALADIPLNMRAEWTGAPIGQIARLLGEDEQGWRGQFDVRAKLSGTPSELAARATLQLNDLHRVEFAPEKTLNYGAACGGTYVKRQDEISGLACVLPVAGGYVKATGTVGLPLQGGTRLDLAIERMPATAVLDFMRVLRKRFAGEVSAGGTIDGHFAVDAADAHPALSGTAHADALTFTAPGLDKPIVLPDVNLTALDEHANAPRPKNVLGGSATLEPALLLAPIKIDLGGPTPILLDGRLDARGYLLHLGGRGEMATLVPMTRATGLEVPGFDALEPVGEANLDVQLRGPWIAPLPHYDEASGEAGVGGADGNNADAAKPSPINPASSGSALTGTIGLHNASFKTPYLANPLTIRAAQASLLDSQVAWSGIVAEYGALRLKGNFRVPAGCAEDTAACTRQFDIALPALDLAELSATLVPASPMMETILSKIESHPSGPMWPRLHGTVRAATATLGTLNLEDAVASVSVESGPGKVPKIEIESLDARALDGMLHVGGTIDAAPDPIYRLEVQLNQASLAKFAELLGQIWGTGSINLSGHVALKGGNREDLLSSAKGNFHFDWTHGGLHFPPQSEGRVPKAPSPFARFDEWTGDGQIHDSALTLERGLLTGSAGACPVQGTIDFGTQLDLKLSTNTASCSGVLTGTFATPDFSVDSTQTGP